LQTPASRRVGMAGVKARCYAALGLMTSALLDGNLGATQAHAFFRQALGAWSETTNTPKSKKADQWVHDNLTGLDPHTGKLTPLFHPRRDRWLDHFAFDGPRIAGLSAVGRATVQVLDVNDARRLELRAEILKRSELV